MQLDNILIVGDSFCQQRHGWPDHLYQQIFDKNKKQIPVTMQTYGVPGGGWWNVRDHLTNIKSQLNEVSLCILIHPAHRRIITSDQSLFLHQPTRLPSKYNNTEIDERVLALSLYYKYIDDGKFSRWAAQQWIKECEGIFNSGTKIIHMFALDELIPYAQEQLKHYVVPTSLFEIALAHHAKEDRVDLRVTSRDRELGFINHFSPDNNIIFARQLYEIINGSTTDFNLTEFKNLQP